MKRYASAGSQRWLQVAVNRKPHLLLGALQRSGAIAPHTSVTWCSPLEKEDFQEYRDGKALEKAGITKANLKKALKEFGPRADRCGTHWGLLPKGHFFWKLRRTFLKLLHLRLERRQLPWS